MSYIEIMQIMHFTPPQLALIFEVNETTIKRWVWSGKIQSSQTSGGHYRVSTDQLGDFLKKYPKISKNSYVLKRLSTEKEQKMKEWEKYYELILSNKHEEAFRLLRFLYISGNSITEIIDNYFVPVLWKIGFEYNQKNISIYEEHRMSFRINEHLSRFEQFIDKKTKKDKKAILLCAEGENHVIPLQMLDLVLSKNTWDTHVLGINISNKELTNAIKNIKPNMVCITKSYIENNPKKFLDKLIILAKKNNILITLGGYGWDKKIQENKKAGVFWFGSMIDFEKFLQKF
jgi:methanogenic corrinoid protein MtbC1